MLEHELDCFVTRTGIARERFESLNMAEEPHAAWPSVRDFGGVMVGGSGDYSVVKSGFDWHHPMLDYALEAVGSGVPFFGSCFGFQALIQALGGEVVADSDLAEVGTHRVHLTEAGQRDPLFGDLPQRFDAQFGHNDSAVSLPDGVIHLAGSQRCRFQAIRLADKPVWATQFHPELDEHANKTRYVRYLVHYADRPMTEDEAWEAADLMHRPTDAANSLLSRFGALLDA